MGAKVAIARAVIVPRHHRSKQRRNQWTTKYRSNIMSENNAPENIVIEHSGDKTSFSAMGSHDMTKPFRQRYVRCDIAERSAQSHRHEFAVIRELFDTLPEGFSAPYAQSPETLRKHALIETGFCDVSIVAFETKDAAINAGPILKQIAVNGHGYAIVIAKGNLVTITTPKSQRVSAMGRSAFQESKKAVIEWIKKECLQISDK